MLYEGASSLKSSNTKRSGQEAVTQQGGVGGVRATAADLAGPCRWWSWRLWCPPRQKWSGLGCKWVAQDPWTDRLDEPVRTTGFQFQIQAKILAVEQQPFAVRRYHSVFPAAAHSLL